MFRRLTVALFGLALAVGSVHADAILSPNSPGSVGVLNAGSGASILIGFMGAGPMAGIAFASGTDTPVVHFRDLAPGDPNAGPHSTQPRLNQLRLGGAGDPFFSGRSGLGIGFGFNQFGGMGGFGQGFEAGGSGFSGANQNPENGNSNNPSQNGNPPNNNSNNNPANSSANGNPANGNSNNGAVNSLLSGGLTSINPNVVAAGSSANNVNPALTGLGFSTNALFGLAGNGNLAPNSGFGATPFAARAGNRFAGTAAPIPEPGTLLVLGLGIAGLSVYTWRGRGNRT